MKRIAPFSLTILAILFLGGCGGNDRNWKETIPVTGSVFVDGEPAEGVMVVFHPVSGMDSSQPTETKSMTNKEGMFSATTYEVGDGAPEGVYKVTLTWPTLNKISMSFDGDKFKGKYAKAADSKYEVSVEAGSPIDMGRLDL